MAVGTSTLIRSLHGGILWFMCVVLNFFSVLILLFILDEVAALGMCWLVYCLGGMSGRSYSVYVGISPDFQG